LFAAKKKKMDDLEPFLFVVAEVAEVLEEYNIFENTQEGIFGDDETESGLVDIPPMKPSITTVLENVENENFKNQKRGKNLSWILLHEYSCLDDAKNFLKNNPNWVKFREHHTHDGKKEYYQCNVSKDCEASLQLFVLSETAKALIFTSKDHKHDAVDKKRGIPQTTKDEIDALFKIGITKPKAILSALEQKNVTPPCYIQLTNYLVQHKTKVLGKSSISLGELEDWAKKNIEVPEDEDTPFVCGFECSFEEKKFRLAITTKQLLENTLNSEMVQADATYKLIWQGFPVLIVGTSDSQRQFHPFCLAICTNETEEDYNFLFSSLKDAVFQVQKQNFQPTILLADAAQSITNGFISAFNIIPLRLMCWAHVKANVDKKLNMIKDKKIRAQIEQEIDVMQTATEKDIFDQASKLFFEKWLNTYEQGVSEFCDYFKKNWIKINSNWFEGASQKTPSTNNGLEAINRTIKSEITKYERLPLGRFLQAVKQLLQGWSKNRNPINKNSKLFAKEPLPSLSLWTSAYNWAISDNVCKKKDTQTYYILPSNSQKETATEAINQFSGKEEIKVWQDFDDFRSWSNSIWKVCNFSGENIWASTCSCRMNQKQYCCKHTVGLGIRLGFVEPPSAAKDDGIEQKRKRGRPQKAKPALCKQ
jgi:hypothetical protein